MKVVAVLLCLSAFVALASSARVVCYFASWTIYRTGNGKFAAANVDPTLCTHVIYAFVGLNETGALSILDDWNLTGLSEAAHLVSLKETNPDLKILVCMGGYNEGSTIYSAVAADPDKRAVMIETVIAFIKQYSFDGFDLDWQFPGQREGDPAIDPANYVTLLGELKEALNAEDYILSATVSGSQYAIDISYPDGAAVTDNLDMLNLMSFDYHGSWDTLVGHNAPLNISHLDRTDGEKSLNVIAGVQHWLGKGADPEKINMGIPLYGRTFTLADATDAELYSAVTGGGTEGPYSGEVGMLGYNEICELYGDVEDIWDDEQQVPHKVVDDQWIGYDTPESIKLKVDYLNEAGLGGAMVWSLDTDDFLGTCGDKYPLLTAVNENLV